MHWLDVAGPPGVGKSTLCDPIWGPHELPVLDELPPADWQDFVDEISRLLTLIRGHPSFVAAVRMNRRSVRKIGTVCRVGGLSYGEGVVKTGPYIQTGLVQRGLGFGWRLNQLGMVAECRRFFELMPASVGVVFLEAPRDVIEARNHARIEVEETAHEDRAFMVSLMEQSIAIAKEALHDRGVPVAAISTTGGIGAARSELLDLAAREPFDAGASRPGGEMETVLPPLWW